MQALRLILLKSLRSNLESGIAEAVDELYSLDSSFLSPLSTLGDNSHIPSSRSLQPSRGDKAKKGEVFNKCFRTGRNPVFTVCA